MTIARSIITNNCNQIDTYAPAKQDSIPVVPVAKQDRIILFPAAKTDAMIVYAATKTDAMIVYPRDKKAKINVFALVTKLCRSLFSHVRGTGLGFDLTVIGISGTGMV